jgi:hypothetical protein
MTVAAGRTEMTTLLLVEMFPWYFLALAGFGALSRPEAHLLFGVVLGLPYTNTSKQHGYCMVPKSGCSQRGKTNKCDTILQH